MTVTRRPVLLGLAALGAAGLAGPAPAEARRPGQPVAVLLSGGPCGEPFLAGVRAAGAEACAVRLDGLDARAVAAARAGFTGPRRVLALVDDGAAAMVGALARAAGARELCSGRWSPDDPLSAAELGFALARGAAPPAVPSVGRPASPGPVFLSFTI